MAGLELGDWGTSITNGLMTNVFLVAIFRFVVNFSHSTPALLLVDCALPGGSGVKYVLLILYTIETWIVKWRNVLVYDAYVSLSSAIQKAILDNSVTN